MSECRDLLMHVQEHRHTIADIRSFVRSQISAFIGFELDGARQQAYAWRSRRSVDDQSGSLAGVRDRTSGRLCGHVPILASARLDRDDFSSHRWSFQIPRCFCSTCSEFHRLRTRWRDETSNRTPDDRTTTNSAADTRPNRNRRRRISAMDRFWIRRNRRRHGRFPTASERLPHAPRDDRIRCIWGPARATAPRRQCRVLAGNCL